MIVNYNCKTFTVQATGKAGACPSGATKGVLPKGSKLKLAGLANEILDPMF